MWVDDLHTWALTSWIDSPILPHPVALRLQIVFSVFGTWVVWQTIVVQIQHTVHVLVTHWIVENVCKYSNRCGGNAQQQNPHFRPPNAWSGNKPIIDSKGFRNARENWVEREWKELRLVMPKVKLKISKLTLKVNIHLLSPCIHIRSRKLIKNAQLLFFEYDVEGPEILEWVLK